MAILKIKDADGNVHEINSIKGPKGDKGDPGSLIETVTQLSMTLPQISSGTFSSVSVDYTPVYANSIISLDIVSCHMKEGNEFTGMPVVFQVLPKYANYQKVEGVKSITAIRMGQSTAKIDIVLKVHEIKL